MDEPSTHSRQSGGAAAELAQLEAAQRQLWATLREEDDPDQRMTLLARFSDNRNAIAALREQLAEPEKPEVGRYRVELVGGESAEPRPSRLQDPEESAPSTTDRRNDWLERSASAEPDPAPERPAFIDPPPAGGRRRPGAYASGSEPRASGSEPRGHRVPGADLAAPTPHASDGYPAPTPGQATGHPGLGDRPVEPATADDGGVPSPVAGEPYGQPPHPPAGAYADTASIPTAPGVAAGSVGSVPEVGGQHSRSGGGPTPMASTGADLGEQVRSVIGQLPPRTYWLAGAVGAVAVFAWLVTLLPLGGDGDDVGDLASEVVAGPETSEVEENIGSALARLGFDSITVDESGDVVRLSGTVASEAEQASVVGAARALSDGRTIDDSGIEVDQEVTEPEAAQSAGTSNETGGRAAAMQAELDRVVAATPIIFANNEGDLTALHSRILNSVASIMVAYPDIRVNIIGFTDGAGADEANRALSLKRAEAVKSYLVSQGVPESSLTVNAMGEETASGSSAIASLERRVEFEVDAATAQAAQTDVRLLKIAVVAPSARNDLAFTQSMVDAVNLVAEERGNVEVAITDATFVPDEAAAAIRSYAEQDYDLVIAHGSQFGTPLIDIATAHPDVAFAWGTASDTFGLPNVYAYDAAAGEGGYVLGAVAALLSQTGVIGVVGPIEVGDAQKYVNGFAAGAAAERPGVSVPVTYTGSFSDLTLAAETAQAHIASGSDVLTGSAQMVVGAVSVAEEAQVLWFGTQANQAELAPSLVVASQVYHWEVILRQIIADIDGETVAGRFYTADLANGGLVIEYNPGFALDGGVRQRADQLVAGIVDGSVVVPG